MEIIGFAGRKESGKSMLSNACVKFGYDVVYMATPLKMLTADLIGVRYEDIDRLKTVESEYPIDEADIEFLHCETEIPTDYLKSKLDGKVFHTVREILQYLGTDVIRNYDNQWHVKATQKLILSKGEDAKVCVGDVRFPNEVDMVRGLGGKVWFIARPNMDNVSNHKSETSVRWRDADFVVINDGSKDALIERWERFMENYTENVSAKIERENDLKKDKANGIKSYNKLSDADKRLLIEPWVFRYSDNVIGQDIKEITVQDNKTVSVVVGNGFVYDIINPLEREELKMKLKC